MSYCVNCGVRLEESLGTCPLCHTPAIDPSQLNAGMLRKLQTEAKKQKKNLTPPFSMERGETEIVKSKDGAIILTVALATTALCCGLLNHLVFDQNLWSIPIIGLCAFFWVVFFPVILFKELPVYAFLIMDAAALLGYLYMISFMTESRQWLTGLAFPIIVLCTALILLLTLLIRKVSASILSVALYIYILVPVLCIGIELLICRFRGRSLHIVWSAIVTAPCAVVSIILITVLSKKRLREALRRRLHF